MKALSEALTVMGPEQAEEVGEEEERAAAAARQLRSTA
jgi:hypothetical protein